MKNIQHGLDMAKQLRKAHAAMAIAEPVKARYIGDLMHDMIESWYDDQPQPWSNFVPMIQEEFE